MLAAESLSPPGCFCEACQNKGDTGTSVRKRVKTGGLESLCFDTDAHCWGEGYLLWGVAERGRACAEYSQAIVAHYLPFFYYYLVGTTFETGTQAGSETQDPPARHESGAPGMLGGNPMIIWQFLYPYARPAYRRGMCYLISQL